MSALPFVGPFAIPHIAFYHMCSKKNDVLGISQSITCTQAISWLIFKRGLPHGRPNTYLPSSTTFRSNVAAIVSGGSSRA